MIGSSPTSLKHGLKLSHTKVQVCGRPISRGYRCRCIWVGLGFGDFLELHKKFIFLMKHRGDISPRGLSFFFLGSPQVGLVSVSVCLFFCHPGSHTAHTLRMTCDCWLLPKVIPVRFHLLQFNMTLIDAKGTFWFF